MSHSRRCSSKGCNKRVVGRRLCKNHYQQAWRRGDFENVPLPPRVSDPKICPPEHKHAGSLVCYNLHQCRCRPCSEHRAETGRRRQKLKAYGRYDTGLVDAAPVREHMMVLAEFGIGYKRVAQIAGLGVTPVRNVIWGRQDPGPRYGELQKRIKRETAERILAVKPTVENLAGGGRTPARGTHRRVQALVCMGWSQSKLADRLGVERGNFGAMMQREFVTARLHRAAVELFEELWDVAPPNELWHDKAAVTRAKAYAKARRWVPPLGWDDIDTDEEPPVPDEVDGVDEALVELAASGEPVRLSPAERRDAVTVLQGHGFSDSAIARRLRVDPRTVLRIRQELGLPAAVGADGQRVVA